MSDLDLDVDTTRYLDPTVSSHYAGPGPGVCGCNPTYGQECPACNGEDAERREMWAMPRRDRLALELANRELDPHWRALHGLDAAGGAA